MPVAGSLPPPMITGDRCDGRRCEAPEDLDGGLPRKRPTRTGGNEIKGGTSPNRPCGCCGSAMEPNRATGPSAAIEYCHRCGREPLCASCSNFEFGWSPAIDMRWARLTFAAANAFPRTVAGVERVQLVTCCHCMGELGEEHEDPEQPLPITHGRPEGWRLCSQCVITMIRHGDGMRTWRHSCTRGGSQHAQTPGDVTARHGQALGRDSPAGDGAIDASPTAEGLLPGCRNCWRTGAMAVNSAHALSVILKHIAMNGTDISVPTLDCAYTFLCRWGRAARCSTLHAHHLPELRERAKLNRALALLRQ